MSSKRNEFLESIKVSPEVQAQLTAVSKNHSSNATSSSSKVSTDSGRERGDNGPASQGRESGLKHGSNTQINNCMNAIRSYQAKNTNGSKNTTSVQASVKSTHSTSGSHGISAGNANGVHSGGVHGGFGNGASGGNTAGGHGGAAGSHGGGHGGK